MTSHRGEKNTENCQIASVTEYRKCGDTCFPGGSDGKESACSAGDPSLNPGLGRPPGGRHGNPLQYSCLENPMDRGAYDGLQSMGLQRFGHDQATNTKGLGERAVWLDWRLAAPAPSMSAHCSSPVCGPQPHPSPTST